MRLAVRDPDKEFAPVDVPDTAMITVLLLDAELPNIRFERRGPSAMLVTFSRGERSRTAGEER